MTDSFIPADFAKPAPVQAFRVRHIIRTDKGDWTTPPGSILATTADDVPEGYAFCEGQSVSISDFPALYAAVGDTFAPRHIRRTHWLSLFFVWLGLIPYWRPNPDYREGRFRIPDMRATAKGRRR